MVCFFWSHKNAKCDEKQTKSNICNKLVKTAGKVDDIIVIQIQHSDTTLMV